MKLFLLLTATLAAATGQSLSEVRTVYLMPMSSGLDQYLAVQLTSNHVFQVVTDPDKADVVFTDRIGVSFEQALIQLHNAGVKPEEPKEAADYSPSMAPLSRGKGSFFLVDHKSHNVIWSTFQERKYNDASHLNRVAERVVGQLMWDLMLKK
jgi:hypothetical protein